MKAATFTLIKGVLYTKKNEAEEVLGTIHSRACENHSGGRSLAHKAITAGYFWPYMMQDAKNFVKKCEKCLKHTPLIHQHSEPCHSVISPWPFRLLGIGHHWKTSNREGMKMLRPSHKGLLH